MPKIDLSSINVLSELERMGWDYDFVSEHEIKCRCPFHPDKNPSCNINVEKRLFRCQTTGCVGNKGGDFVTFMAKALDTTRVVVFTDLKKRYGIETSKTIGSQLVERYHTKIWNAKVMLRALYERGLTDTDIRQYRLGFHDGRITIPIYNANGHCVNIRRYMPGAPGPEKMRNTRGHGKPIRLYPIKQLSYDTVVVCGGELKAQVTARLLNPHNIGAITTTGGEGNWETSLTKEFKDKRVYVCLDIDKDGRAGADKICARLLHTARWVGKAELPLDPDKYPHGDVNDWVGKENASDQDFLRLLDEVEEWIPVLTHVQSTDEPPLDVYLTQSVDASNTGKRIRVNAVISALDTAPYVIPRRVNVRCDRDQNVCALCPYLAADQDQHGFSQGELSPESPALLEMIACPKRAQREALMSGLGIPSGCKCVQFDVLSHCNIEDTRVSPQLEISDRSSDHILQPAFCLGVGLEANESYRLTGRMYPHPQTQQSVLLISDVEATQDALSNYAPDSAQLGDLDVFKPKRWTLAALQQKLDEIYSDLEANVTRIYERRDMHLVVDLTYHSVLLFPFDGRLEKGWVETLILGDSAQGKSETTMRLQSHYGLGEKIECKNATVAGLLGGLQKIGNRWFVTWGVIPTHDRRLVILEELKGAHTDVIGKLTDMRSSGVAEIPKIEKRRTHARTRLIALSNPRSDHSIRSYNFGVDAITELIGGLEDIRRFDLSLLVSSDEIDASHINELQKHRPKIKHTFTDELSRRLVLWSWTRSETQVVFQSSAVAKVLEEATRLCSIFSESIPLVDRGSMRFKLGRLAAALACRTWSTSDDRQSVVIRKCHVEYVSAFLERIYSSTVSGYRHYSEAKRASAELRDPEGLKTRISQLPFPKDFVQAILHQDEIELQDLQDWLAYDRTDALEFLSVLRRKHAIQRVKRSYRKTPEFIRLLKSLERSIADRPEYINEENAEF